MIIRNNRSALNTNRYLNKSTGNLSKVLEKLSTGYQVNRAADNAAGLAISEKLRSLIGGTNQAVKNSIDAISLIQTAEGALQEVHSILSRMKTLATQSANGIYDDDVDRTSIQLEFENLQDEIDFISEHTDFDGMMLFDGTGGVSVKDIPAMAAAAAKKTGAASISSDIGSPLKNIFYTETVYDFNTTQTANGTGNSFDAQYQNIADTLKTSIVPQVVKSLTDTYTSFGYLNGSSIGIGLNLYSDSSSSTLASVSLKTYYSSSGSSYTGTALEYTLKVNVGKADISTEAGRSALEQTIAHEMIHAFMDEATTAGMTGITPSGVKSSESFPDWFIEGMAQTASGPGNWTRGTGLNLSTSSTTAQISSSLGSSTNKLGSGTNESKYGTGYLACMYLGYLAAGSDADMTNPRAAAADIADGVSNILTKLVKGNSLDSVIKEISGGKYNTTSAFASGFASDTSAAAFIQQLLKYTSSSPNNDGNVGGGLIGGDLSATDPVPNSNISGINLFALNTSNTAIKNTYPSDITILSGGTKTAQGIPEDPSLKTYPTGIFTVTGGTEGTDWSFDQATGTLNILTGKNMTISGGKLTNADGTFYGNIVIKDGTDANITLSGVDIDASNNGGNKAGISVGDNSTATIKISGTNTVKGSGYSAGIELSDSNADDGKSKVIIDSQSGSTLNVTGGNYGAGIGAARSSNASASSIEIIGSGTINAKSGEGSAAIGSGFTSQFGDILINGSDITIKAIAGNHGAGIGGGWTSSSTVGDITIIGSGNITAEGVYHGTGIGAGCSGKAGVLTIGDPGADDSKLVISATGGDQGAAIGSSWNGSVKDIIINSGTINATAGEDGAGIGSGNYGSASRIVINGGNISAKGSTDASGIGGGKDGTISSIEINGGEITAKGGWTYDGGNIGGYTDRSGTNKTTVTISDPSGLSIKAGSGEGKYITTGTTDADGNKLYALDVSYIDSLLKKGKTNLTDNGSDPSSLSYPLSISAVTADGKTYSWSDLQHFTEDSAYIWMKGQDITLYFTDADGTKGSVDLKFYDDYGMWRADKKDLPPEKPKEPGYNSSSTPTPTPSPQDEELRNIWVMQTGPRSKDTFTMFIDLMNTTVLGIDKSTVDVRTQPKANETIDLIGNAISKISFQRASLGAYQNRLEHKIDNLNVSIENAQSAESRIRDADMAENMMLFTKEQIIHNAAQAMLAQANSIPQGVINLLG